jgi:hypothetical protein
VCEVPVEKVMGLNSKLNQVYDRIAISSHQGLDPSKSMDIPMWNIVQQENNVTQVTR